VGDAAEVAGLDLESVTRWLDREHPGLRRGDLRARIIAGGRSNITYALDDDTHRLVLRRPPLGHVLATAHDMAREHRVISALGGSPVPVPATVALCDDREHRVISALGGSPVPVPATVALCDDLEVLGAPFYLMERVEGDIVRTREQLLQVPAAARAPLAHRLVDTLAALHGVDPGAVGLADFGRPDGFLHRQVRRWGQQLDASRSRDVDGIDDLHAALGAAVPTSQRATVVHGDYRLDNVLVGPGYEIAAVLDWEMSTLGDPLTDIGLLLVYWGDGQRGTLGSVTETPGSVEGYPGGADLAERYAAASGLDLSPLPWYVAMGCFKLAVVLEGIHYRYTQGQTVGAGFDTIGAVVPGLVAAGRANLI